MLTIAELIQKNRRGVIEILTIMTITIAAILIFYFTLFAMGFTAPTVLLATICFCVLWCCTVAPAVCTMGKTWIKKLFRAGTVSDSTGITLIIIWLIFPNDPLNAPFDIWAALKVYVLCTSLTMFAGSLACVAKKTTGVIIAAVISWLIFLTAISTPFWMSDTLEFSKAGENENLINVAACVNPIWAALDAVVTQTLRPWHRGGGVLYNFTAVGEYTTPTNFGWWQTSICFGAGAVFFWLVAYLRRKLFKTKSVNLKINFDQ